MRTFILRMEDDLFTQLNVLAQADDRNKSSYLRHLINQEYNKKKFMELDDQESYNNNIKNEEENN